MLLGMKPHAVQAQQAPAVTPACSSSGSPTCSSSRCVMSAGVSSTGVLGSTTAACTVWYTSATRCASRAGTVRQQVPGAWCLGAVMDTCSAASPMQFQGHDRGLHAAPGQGKRGSRMTHPGWVASSSRQQPAEFQTPTHSHSPHLGLQASSQPLKHTATHTTHTPDAPSGSPGTATATRGPSALRGGSLRWPCGTR